MKTLLTVLFLLATLVMTAHPALAGCTPYTIIGPDGKVQTVIVCT